MGLTTGRHFFILMSESSTKKDRTGRLTFLSFSVPVGMLTIDSPFYLRGSDPPDEQAPISIYINSLNYASALPMKGKSKEETGATLLPVMGNQLSYFLEGFS